MGEQRVVIIGAGQGGFQAAASLRQDAFSGAITLIGDEPGLPYQRPPLSKAYLKDGDAARLALRPEKFYADNQIDYRAGVRAAQIDRSAGAVIAAAGEAVPYDHLILATGSRNRTPPIENLALNNVFALRTLADAEALRARMPSVRHAIIIGGGFIGLEFAAVARGFDVKTTVIEGAERLMARAVSPQISAFFRTAHEQMGATLDFGRFASALLGEGAVAGVRLSDGAEIEGDMVVVAAGVEPNVELAAAAGLSIDNGVAVDALLLTSDPAISALGDCCSFPEPTRGERVRLESVQAATDHARAISKRLTGAPAPYAAVPWFWSDQGAFKLQIAGLGTGADAFETRQSGDDALTVHAFAQDRLISIETVNAPGDHMAGRKLLGSGRALSRAQLQAADWDLRALAKG